MASLPSTTKAIVLASYPAGKPTPDNFRAEEVALPAQLQDGEVHA